MPAILVGLAAPTVAVVLYLALAVFLVVPFRDLRRLPVQPPKTAADRSGPDGSGNWRCPVRHERGHNAAMLTSAWSAAKSRRIAVGVVVVWSLAVAGALATTLHSLRTEDFDGLNNMSQVPFALPWFLLPLPAVTGWSYEADAWVVAGMGWLNGLILGLWIALRLPKRT